MTENEKRLRDYHRRRLHEALTPEDCREVMTNGRCQSTIYGTAEERAELKRFIREHRTRLYGRRQAASS